MSLFHCYDVNIEAKNIVHYKDSEQTRSARERKHWIVTSCKNFYGKIMIFIVMDNGMACPPTSKSQKIRTGNYHLIWSGLRYSFLEIEHKMIWVWWSVTPSKWDLASNCSKMFSYLCRWFAHEGVNLWPASDQGFFYWGTKVHWCPY